jgi:hypothetical protein
MRAVHIIANWTMSEERNKMKRLSSLGLVVLAAFAVSAVMAAAIASANPSILPTPTEKEPLNVTTEGGGATTITSGTNKIECEKNKILEFSFRQGEKAVDAHITLEGNCKNAATGNKCKTEGEENGRILILVDLTLVDILPGNVLTLGILVQVLNNKLEPAAIKITCGVGQVEVKGAFIGEAQTSKGEKLKSLEKVRVLLFLSKEKESKQEFKECDELPAICLNEKKEHLNFELLAKFSVEEAFKEGRYITHLTIVFAREVEIHF